VEQPLLIADIPFTAIAAPRAGQPINLAVALIAFTLGVELAHQGLIVPLYFLLRPLRRSAADAPADALPRGALALRLASLLISFAGAFYLIQALRGA
jgi:regulator of sirC expression with transglutaminase-like and TPR domain